MALPLSPRGRDLEERRISGIKPLSEVVERNICIVGQRPSELYRHLDVSSQPLKGRESVRLRPLCIRQAQRLASSLVLIQLNTVPLSFAEATP